MLFSGQVPYSADLSCSDIPKELPSEKGFFAEINRVLGLEKEKV